MDFPHFLKRHSTSSIAERVRLEVSEVQSNLTEKEDTGIQDGEDQPQLRAQSQAGGDEVAGDTDTDIEGGDTDVVVSSEGEGKHEDEGMEIGKTENRGKSGDDMETPPIRMSKRLMSLKRRGKFIQPREETEQIEFYAGDILTVRGGDTDFFVCRVLEDVLEDAKNFSVAWYNRIGDNLYEVSYDDICYMDSVITRVKLLDKGNEQYSVLKSHVKQTKKLLREVLQSEKKDVKGLIEDDDDGDIADEEDDADEPPSKKRKLRTVRKRAAKGEVKEKKEKKPREKKEKKQKEVKRRGLVPNPEIELVDKDPLFETKSDIPLTPVKRAIRAVLLNDMDMLKEAIDDTEHVYTIHWERSSDVRLGPIHYALLTGNHKALDLLAYEEKSKKERKAKCPNITLSKMDTGKYNFYTFGHAVRPIEASRGSKEGNNAFLKEGGSLSNSVDDDYLMSKGISLETIQHYVKRDQDPDEGLINEIWRAVRNGHRKLAGYYVTKAVEKDGFGFNFLHKEVLVNETEPLSPFRVQSVTKKPYDNQKILPLHCACINPNTKYMQALFNSVPEYLIADLKGRKPIHYAAACEGPGPLRFLITRGVDPNDIDREGTTPLMIAARLGRDENIKELMSVTIEEDEQMTEDAETEDMNDEPRKEVKRVNINAKNKKTKAAIHYAAKHGHETTVRALVEHGATVDLQTSANLGNFTALMYAAEQGHLDVVKALVELGAAPDKKVKQNKTALMIAAQNGHYKVMAYLLRIGVNPNAQDSSLNTPIHYASAYGWYHCVQLLLEAGANPSVANNWKTTPLAVALMKDNVPCADLLLSVDVDVNFPDDEGCTILIRQILLEYNDDMFDKVKYLVEKKGADINRADLQGNAPESGINRPQLKKESAEICCKIAEVLIKAGASINEVNSKGQTPMMIAVMQNNFPLIKLLVKNGADASAGAETETEKTILHCLIEKSDDLDLLEYFDDGKDRSTLSDDQLKKIHEQQDKKAKKEILELLVDNGADFNAQAKNGETPLMISFSRGNLDAAEILLNKGADPTLGKNKIGHNILHIMALKCTSFSLTTYLSKMQKKFDFENMINVVDNDGFTPLLISCEVYALSSEKEQQAFGRDFIKALVENYKADTAVVVADKNFHSSLGLDLSNEKEKQHRNVPNFGMSIEKDKKVNDDDDQCVKNLSCLHYLAMALEKLARLTQKGKEVTSPALGMFLNLVGRTSSLLNLRDRHGRTPLHLAIHKRNTHAALSLIEHGADVNVLSENKDEDGLQSPLCMASRPSCQLEVVKALLEAKADPNLTDGKHNRCSLSYAVTNRSDDNVAPLELTEIILKAGASVNAADDDKRTALHYSANVTPGGYETLTEMEELLVKYGADTVVLDNFQRLPLHYSFIKINNEEDQSMTDPISIVNMLCDAAKEQGKDVSAMLNTPDKDGRTPLHVGAMRGATISCLHMLKHGASLSLQDKDKNLPISLALRGEHHGCAMMLIQEGSTANCDVIRAVTENQMKEYEKQKKESIWRYKPSVSISEPQAFMRSAFYVAVEKDWQGLAYVMLEVAKLPFIDAFKAALKAKKLRLLWTLLKKQRHNEPLMATDDHDSNLLHLLATYVTTSYSSGMDLQNLLARGNKNGTVLDLIAMCEKKRTIKYSNKIDKFCQIAELWSLSVSDSDNSLEDYQVPGEDQEDDIDKDEMEDTDVGTEEDEDEVENGDEDEKEDFDGILPKIDAKDDKIGELLIKRGVNPGALDSTGATPLHYAAYNAHFSLCKLFVESSPESVNVANKEGMTPVAAVFDQACDFGNVQRDHVKVAILLVESGVNSLDICYKTNTKLADGTDETTTILNDQVIFENSGNFNEVYSSSRKEPFGSLEYLLDNGADVNFSNDIGVTPLMVAVQLNYENMVKILLKYNPNMTITSKDGNSLVHQCVNNKEYCSSENVSLLKLLVQKGAPVNLKNKDGHGPLFYAKQQMSGVMAEVLRSLGAKDDEDIPMETGEPGFAFQNASSLVDQVPDISGDSEKELLKLKDKDTAREVTGPPPVDKAFSMGGTGEVYIDPQTEIPYDVVLSKVDVKWGTYGLNNFYKLQIIHHKGKDLWILFNRWGRVGDEGKHQQTPFSDPAEACSEFKKIFKSKTGNDWANFPSNFEKKPKKYALVLNDKNPERMLHHHDEILEGWDLKKCPESTLPEEMQSFMKDIADLAKFKNSLHVNNLLDTNYMPFGLISWEVIEQAKEVLQKIRDIVQKLDKQDTRGNPEAASSYEEVAQLSNEFYMMIPPSHYRFERIRPLNTEYQVNEKLKELRSLTELSHANQLLLAAQHRKTEVNPLDYCYRGLGCRVEVMDPSSKECQLILEYIENAPGSYTVKGIYRVHRFGEENNFEECGIKDNRKLLWHGTKTAHMIGILNHGLQIDPPHAISTGNAYGSGIYFSYSLDKAIGYSSHWNEKVGHVLLCEVALGKMHVLDGSDHWNFESREEGTNSVWVTGQKVPNPRDDVTTPYGAKIQVGTFTENESYKGRWSRCHECVVFDPRQVRMRYIVMIAEQ